MSEPNPAANSRSSAPRLRRGSPKWAKIALAALVFIIAFAEFAPYLLDLDRYRNEIASLLAEQTGRPVRLGKLRAQFLPRLGFVVQAVQIGNPPGFAPGNLASADEVRATIAFWPLLRRHVELNSVELVRPRISLIENAQGQCNYLLASAPHAEAVSEAGFSDSAADATIANPSFSLVGIGNIRLTDAEIQFGKIGASGAVIPQFDLQHLNGNLSSVALSPLDLSRWQGEASLRGLQATLPDWPQPITFLFGSLNLDNGHVKADFSANLGAPGDLRGVVLVTDVANPVVQFDLQSNQLTLDAIPNDLLAGLPVDPAEDPPGGQIADPPSASHLVAQGRLAAQRIRWETYTAGPLTAELRLFNDRAELWPFTLGVYGGVVQATARVDRSVAPARFSANIQARTLDLGRLLGDSPSLKGKLYGVSEFDLQLFGSLDAAWQKSLTGTGKFSVRNGHLPSVNLSGPPGASADANAVANSTPFSRISGDVAIANQRFASRKIHIEAPSGIVDLRGNLGFTGAIDYQGQITFPAAVASSSPSATGGIAGYLSEILRSAASGLVVPFTLKGTLAQPQVLPVRSAPASRPPR
ncbi:MAG: AsmA family protein [Candidatus Acidiferrales bacterium]